MAKLTTPATTRSRAPSRVEQFHHDGLVFDVADQGPLDGEPIVLLHGWPGGARTWDAVAPLLHRAGLRTLAPDQRGYSPGARPYAASSYRMGSLADDITALLDAAGLDDTHVVGHDWGGAVAWHLAATAPERLKTMTVLSTPHPGALAASLWSSNQLLRSAYVGTFQLPVLPERILSARNGAVLRRLLEASGLDAAHAETYAEGLASAEAVGGSLAWYRALLRPTVGGSTGQSRVPTLYVWSSGDSALGRRAAQLTADHVDAAYRFEVLEGVSHWIPETASAIAAQLIISRVRSADA